MLGAVHRSKWSVIPGWHCLRHSFISNCAARGVDQRLIDHASGTPPRPCGGGTVTYCPQSRKRRYCRCSGKRFEVEEKLTRIIDCEAGSCSSAVARAQTIHRDAFGDVVFPFLHVDFLSVSHQPVVQVSPVVSEVFIVHRSVTNTPRFMLVRFLACDALVNRTRIILGRLGRNLPAR